MIHSLYFCIVKINKILKGSALQKYVCKLCCTNKHCSEGDKK